MTNNISGGALAGLAGHYGSDSEEDADESNSNINQITSSSKSMWSICVDPNTGCPYYWDQITNEVSWELPSGVAVSNNPIIPSSINSNKSMQSVNVRQTQKNSQIDKSNQNKVSEMKKSSLKKPELPSSDEEEEKIELITSYYNTDSGSGEENNDDKLPNAKHKQAKTESKRKDKTTAPQYGPELPEDIKKSLMTSQVQQIVCGPNILEKNNQILSINNSNTVNINNTQKIDNSNRSNKLNEKEIGNIKNDVTVNDDSKNNENILSNSFLQSSDKSEKDNISSSLENKIKNSNENESSNHARSLITPESDNLDELMMVQANLLKKLGELGPNDIKYLNGSVENSSISRSRTQSPLRSPAIDSPGAVKKSTALDMDVDDLIAQIEMEQPIDQPSITSNIASSGSVADSQDESLTNKSTLFPEGTTEVKADTSFKPLFPSVNFSESFEKDGNTKSVTLDVQSGKLAVDSATENTTSYKYDSASINNDGVENTAFKRKRRIAIDILPEKKQIKPEDCTFKKDLLYTTKYAQNNDISGNRVGLGFSSVEVGEDSEKLVDNKNSYPNFKKGDSLVFQKLESTNTSENNSDKECPKDDSNSKLRDDDEREQMEETKNSIEAKLKFLVQNLPLVPPVQQLSIELQTLWGALSSGALQKEYVKGWLLTADSTLARLEASAVSHPWICRFHSGAGCYVYEHVETGKIQWEYPGDEAPPPPSTSPPAKPPIPPSPSPSEPTDMDISTTPPPQTHQDVRSHINIDNIEPMPPGVETPTGMSSPILSIDDTKGLISTNETINGYKQTENSVNNFGCDKLGAELDSFYSDLAALEDNTNVVSSDKSSASVPIIKKQIIKKIADDTTVNKEKKKKVKVKAPNTMKDKTVSKLVEKWKKVQETLDD